MGRKPIPILLKATSPEGETRTFTSISEAARELGFSERGVRKAFHEKRNRIGDYELEWLEPKVEPKSEFEKIKESKTLNCWICGMPLDCKDRLDERCLVLEKLDINTGAVIEESFPKTLYGASQLSGLSLSTLRHAIEKGNRLVVRRKDKQPFKLTWCSSHEACFEHKKEPERLEFRKKLDGEVAKKKEEERLEREEWERKNEKRMEEIRREHSS